MTDTAPDSSRHPARALGAALEPVIGQVYFAPECHARYAELGFAPSPGEMNGVALPDGPAYFTSRGSLLGQVPGEVVAAAFAVFNPEVVVPSVAFGANVVDAATICAARDAGALAHLERHLGGRPDGLDRVEALLRRACEPLAPAGRPLAAGLLALPERDHPLGPLFRLGDRLREYRGDSHTAAWTAAGLSATEIGLLTELYWGLRARSYSRTRAWTDDHYEAAEQRLRADGFIAGGGDDTDPTAFTDAGRQVREQIEIDTDRQMGPVIAALGDDLDDLLAILGGWGATIRAGHGYPQSGPHQLATRGGARG
ncbi:MAG: hypothetical protein ACFCVK_14670 [Acidimicrobiales bacterium]